MGADSKIEWCNHTFNPWRGCTAISPACDHCYAKTLVEGRLSGDFGQRVRSAASTWKQPLAWNRKAEREGVRYRVFCASLADVFDNQVPAEWRADLWALIRATPHLDWLLLTKRPQNIAGMLPPDWGDGWPTVWLGATVENQTEADRRIPHLLAVPAAVRFLSCEPLLGPVELDCIPWPADWMRPVDDPSDGFHALRYQPHHITWVICGGESGPGSRPMHPAWARSLRDQCEATGVAFHFKQWGEWGTAAISSSTGHPVFRQFHDFQHWVNKASTWVRGGICLDADGRELKIGADFMHARDEGKFPVTIMHKVGKRAAGRLLDGRAWDQFPGGAA